MGIDIQQEVKMKSNEWYTPAKYIEAAREVFGGVIDLDPASCEYANRTVQATRYYTEEQDGLLQKWDCTSMWINPPYGTTKANAHQRYGGTHTGHSRIKLFLKKLLEEYEQGNIGQAILLCRADCKASWFLPLWHYPLCFCHQDINFTYPDGSLKHHRFGTVFVYFGSHEDTFTRVFSQFGTIAKRVEVQP